MSIYEDHRKRIAFSQLSNVLEFRKVETMQYGDKMQFGFEFEGDRFMATFNDRAWRVAALKADASKPKYEKRYILPNGEELLLLLSDLVPVGAYSIIEDALTADVLDLVYFPILSFILAELGVPLDRKNIIRTPAKSKEICGKSIVVVKNPSVGFMYMVLYEDNGSLILSYKLSKTASKKNAEGYEDMLNASSYGYVDLVTKEGVNSILKELKIV